MRAAALISVCTAMSQIGREVMRCRVSGSSAAGYLSGNGLLTATTLGRIAGRTAARVAGKT